MQKIFSTFICVTMCVVSIPLALIGFTGIDLILLFNAMRNIVKKWKYMLKYTCKIYLR